MPSPLFSTPVSKSVNNVGPAMLPKQALMWHQGGKNIHSFIFILIYPFIHFYMNILIHWLIHSLIFVIIHCMDPKPIPGTLRVRLECTLDETPVHCISVLCGKNKNDPIVPNPLTSTELRLPFSTCCCIEPVNCVKKKPNFSLCTHPFVFLGASERISPLKS